MQTALSREDQGNIWNFYKPRHTHAWNMLVLSWRSLDELSNDGKEGFEIEYRWENFIIRLWLYRTTVATLAKITTCKEPTLFALETFDSAFSQNDRNALKTLRDMIEHFDDYAAGVGRGPADRESDLDPWRHFTKDCYNRGNWVLQRKRTYDAAIALRDEARVISASFIEWFNSTKKH